MKQKWVVVLTLSLLVAGCIGFFIYKKVEDGKYVEVKFIDGYNNEVLSTQKLEVGKDAKEPEVPKHDGCEFTGWYTKDNVKVISFTNMGKDLTVYALCNQLSYKVKFYDTIAKKVIDTQEVGYGQSAKEPDAPNHYGYNFVRWKGNFKNVKSNLTINTVYAAQGAKYIVKYYTVDESNNTKLYTTKTYNSYVNYKVKAKIISIGGYKYDSSNSLNKLSGRVNIDNSLVLKVYYGATTYRVTVNGSTMEYNYNDTITLPALEQTATLTYQENANVINKLPSSSVGLTHIGYCKNTKKCDSKNMLSPNTVVTVTEDATYYPVFEAEMSVTLPTGEGYTEDEVDYYFVGWVNEDGEYHEGETFTFTEDTTLIATYKKDTGDLTGKYPYLVNTFYDGELYSSLTEYAEIGSQVFGSKYTKEIVGYVLDNYTKSIYVSKNINDSIIELYYVTDNTVEAEYYVSANIIDETDLDSVEVDQNSEETIDLTSDNSDEEQQLDDNNEEIEVESVELENDDKVFEETKSENDDLSLENEIDISEELFDKSDESETIEELIDDENETNVNEEVLDKTDEIEVNEELMSNEISEVILETNTEELIEETVSIELKDESNEDIQLEQEYVEQPQDKFEEFFDEKEDNSNIVLESDKVIIDTSENLKEEVVIKNNEVEIIQNNIIKVDEVETTLEEIKEE